MEGPLGMFFGWQPLLLAALAVPLTQLVKTVLDLAITADRRKGNRWLSKVVLPSLPVIFCALAAGLLPIRPEALIDYVAKHVEGGFLEFATFAAWGAACGQFSTTLYDKLRDFIKHGRG